MTAEAEQGSVIAGRYRLVEHIGTGGVGTVWRAVDEQLQREVAVKELRLGPRLTAAQRAEIAGQALAEARHAAVLTHPHVVAVYDAVVDDDRPFIVMQLVQGASLEEVVRRDGPLPLPEVRHLADQLLDALEAAHAAGVVHRDVKPSNVLVTPDGRAFLTDFSIAKPVGSGTATDTGMMMGSPGYIAPERVVAGRVTAASDLFGLGATLFFAVEGRAAFDRDDPVAGAFAAAVHPHPRPERAGELTGLIDALLVKAPQERATIEVARALLRAGVAATIPLQRPESAPAVQPWPGAVQPAAVFRTAGPEPGPDVAAVPTATPASMPVGGGRPPRRRQGRRRSALIAAPVVVVLATTAAFALHDLRRSGPDPAMTAAHATPALAARSAADSASPVATVPSVSSAATAPGTPTTPTSSTPTAAPAAGTAPRPVPVVLAAALAGTTAPGHAYTADASGSSISGSVITAYTFDFGDGTVLGPQTDPVARHVYAKAGAYLVRLTVTAATGATATRSTTVTIPALPPKAALFLDIESRLPATVLDASGTRPGEFPIATYQFTFSNGMPPLTTSDPRPAVNLTKRPVTVTLVVVDSHGQASAAVSQTLG